MYRNEIFKEVQEVLSEQLGIEEDKIALRSNIITDLGADSIDLVELLIALEEKFDIEIPDSDAERITTVKGVVHYIHKRIYKNQSKDPRQIIENLTQNLNHVIKDGKESVSSIVSYFLNALINVLEISRDETFVYLLVGRTGVGKSSTINALMGKKVAETSRSKPTTMDVTFYNNEINGVSFTVVDTPGLCDDYVEKGKDSKYLEAILTKVPRIDLLWFVTPIYETRIRRDELDGIKIITEAFGTDIWKHSIIVFTFADKADEDYAEHLQERTENIQGAIAEYVGTEIAGQIPAVAVDNKKETTPDGKVWLAELYTRVFVRMSEISTIPFLLTTVNRLSFIDAFTASDSEQKTINLDEEQKGDIRNKLFSVIPALRFIGEKIGYAFGSVVSTLTSVEESKSIGSITGSAIGETIGEKVDDWINPVLRGIKELMGW